MIGSHLSIAGGLHRALLEAHRLGFGTVQIFARNQQQWAAPPLDESVVTRWKQTRRQLGFTVTVVHASYLINLASPDEQLRRRSIDLAADELTRCARLGVGLWVVHPGAHMGAGEAAGIARVAAAIDELHRRLQRRRVTICLESTAGQGSSLGHSLEQLAAIAAGTRRPERVGVCLDTAHLFAAGYDFRGRRYAGFMRQVDATVGIGRIRAWHLNDSKKSLGSHVDRHEHIGHGTIGLSGFRPIMRDRRFVDTPMILETAKGMDDQGREWDLVNRAVLEQLATSRTAAGPAQSRPAVSIPQPQSLPAASGEDE